MGRQLIAFFSSDARELYKVDVYRAAALPQGYVIHFRYERRYVHAGLLSQISKLKKSPGVIFFLAGNDLKEDANDRILTRHSLREVVIRDVVEDLTIDTFHFYLELGPFIDASPHSSTDASLLPPNAFVSEISVEEGPNKTWLHRVKELTPFFKSVTFFSVQAVSHGKKTLKPTYDQFSRSSEYSLAEESKFQCKLTWYDPDARDTGFSVTNTSSVLVDLAIPPNHRLGAQKDTAIFEVYTHSLAQKQASSLSYIQDRKAVMDGKEEPDAWRVELKWSVTRGKGKAILFGALSTAAACGLVLAKLATDNLGATTFGRINYVLAAVAVPLIWVSAGWLYAFFNKK